MITTTNVCPFTNACTIASACNKVFRKNVLKPNTIGIIPKGGYRMTNNQSMIALKWMVWEENQRKITIQHAGRGQEAILSGLKVDGFCENQVFEFQGCYYHGCPRCFKHQHDEPLSGDPTESMNFRYESTVAKIERLRAAGYDVIEKWECDFRREMRENTEIGKYVENHPLLSHSPLNPRNAFYGGRTGNCRTYYKTKGVEKIKWTFAPFTLGYVNTALINANL
ncbi:unnamed protein product [Brassicogethes aeneus]|uniref:DNA polymerase n=1 Tax=Brassicogethes aeneus TaxID=1431903 RepID=A0A9P0AS82_BRAAE|nr:unnamed protein product [Brassicogethes aeneus]